MDLVFDGINPFNSHKVINGCLVGLYKDERHQYTENNIIDLSTLTTSLKEISRNCFINNKRLNSYLSNNDLEVVGNNAFTNSSIEELKLGIKIQYIGIESFSYCTNLKDVYIESECVNVVENAFAYCSNLKKITFKGYANILPNAFIGCLNLKEIHVENCNIKLFQKLFLPQDVKIYASVNGNYYRWCIKNNVEVIGEK